MAVPGEQYPDHLNPFGDEEDDAPDQTIKISSSDYPDHLDPFGDDGAVVEDYDDSLNPFGADADTVEGDSVQVAVVEQQVKPDDQVDDNNPFADEIKQEKGQQEIADDRLAANTQEQTPDTSITQSLDSLEPPKPLPRKKSLLKKEQRMKRLQELQQSTVGLNSHVPS